MGIMELWASEVGSGKEPALLPVLKNSVLQVISGAGLESILQLHKVIQCARAMPSEWREQLKETRNNWCSPKKQKAWGQGKSSYEQANACHSPPLHYLLRNKLIHIKVLWVTTPRNWEINSLKFYLRKFWGSKKKCSWACSGPWHTVTWFSPSIVEVPEFNQRTEQEGTVHTKNETTG